MSDQDIFFPCSFSIDIHQVTCQILGLIIQSSLRYRFFKVVSESVNTMSRLCHAVYYSDKHCFFQLEKIFFYLT